MVPTPPEGSEIEVIKGGSKEPVVAQPLVEVPIVPAFVMLLQVGVVTVTVTVAVFVQPFVPVTVTV